MKSKYLALGLSVVLTLSLVSCGGQQAQEPQEPAQDIQQAEPVTPEPSAEPMEVKQEVKATDSQSAPVEGEQDTGNEVDPTGTAGETEPEKPAESPQEVTPTEPAKSDTEPQQSQEAVTQQQTSTPQLSTDGQQDSAQQTSQNKDGWDQSFYDTLTPEQKAVYEGLSASSRNQMKNNILNQREREANGWTVDHGDPTEEDLKNAWSNIQMG